MARYIDADLEVSDYVTVWDCDCSEFGRQTVMAVDDLQYLPTADVVPKSEVDKAECEIERLKAILNYYALEYGTVRERQKVIDDAKSEVAREIFEEIYEDCFDQYGYINYEALAELKKKYTE